MRMRPNINANLVLLLFIFTSSCVSSNNNQAEIINPKPTQGALVMLNDLPSSTATQNQPTYTPITSSTSTITTQPSTLEHTATPHEIETIPPNQSPTCTNQAEFIKNLTVGNNTALIPGQYFAKIWQIKNSGTCTWTNEYNLIFISGNNMNSPDSIGLQESVAPGKVIDLRLDLVAPNEEGNHSGNWMLQDNLGNLFGIGQSGNQPLEVVIIVKPTPMPTSGCVQCQVDDDDAP